jgi:hypothetical protein
MKTPDASCDREHGRIASTRSGRLRLLSAGLGIAASIAAISTMALVDTLLEAGVERAFDSRRSAVMSLSLSGSLETPAIGNKTLKMPASPAVNTKLILPCTLL